MASEYFELAKKMTRAAYHAPATQADPVEPDWDYLLDQEREPSLESLRNRAERMANEAAPDGCTCPNNGGGDCPWCSVYFDIMENNSD